MSNKEEKEILNKIREFRNNQLEEARDNRVFYTRLMALKKGEKTGKIFYRIIEEYSVGDNQSKIRELFYEFDYENNIPILVAILDPEKANIILPSEIENEQEYQEWIQELDEEEKSNWLAELQDIENGRDINYSNIKEAAKQLGIQQIEGLTEIEIYKKLDENNKKTDKEREEKDEKQKNEPTVIPKEDAKRCGMIGLNTVWLGQRVTPYSTLKEELGLTDEKYADLEYIEMIPTYKMTQYDGKVYDEPFVPIGIRKNGERIALPEKDCMPDKSDNDLVTTIDGKNDSVRRNKEDCIYRFPGKGSLVIEQKKYGIMDASLAYIEKSNDGRLASDLLTKRDGLTKLETISLQAINPRLGEYHVSDALEEANSHPKEELEEGGLGVKDANGDPNDYTHQHRLTRDTILKYEGTDMTIAKIAELPRFKIERVEDFIRIIENALNNGKTLKEAYDEADEYANSYIPAERQSN